MPRLQRRGQPKDFQLLARRRPGLNGLGPGNSGVRKASVRWVTDYFCQETTQVSTLHARPGLLKHFGGLSVAGKQFPLPGGMKEGMRSGVFSFAAQRPFISQLPSSNCHCKNTSAMLGLNTNCGDTRESVALLM